MTTPTFDYMMREYASFKNIVEEHFSNGQIRYRQKIQNGPGCWVSKDYVTGLLLKVHTAVEESRRWSEEQKLQQLEDAFGSARRVA
jgi:hypothetical protein